ncbi:hypothetical protein AVEN_197008-1 [Araneus ventricosus]|uniref:Uncharacterized protein n=1 Tax=Araneus ventricosus TaxID=182803 RepID=A0A4Y2EAN7_ARAVE|nr:hypothetical protein AVEN_197008-1 [Araneus ventricosus]
MLCSIQNIKLQRGNILHYLALMDEVSVLFTYIKNLDFICMALDFRFEDSINLASQIAILVCSKVAASLTRQECKLKTSCSNELATTRRTCSKLVASNTLQTIARSTQTNPRQPAS